MLHQQEKVAEAAELYLPKAVSVRVCDVPRLA